MSWHHIKQNDDKAQRDERWASLKPQVRLFMAGFPMNNSALAKTLGLNTSTTNKWFTVDCPTTPKNEVMDKLEALIHEN